MTAGIPWLKVLLGQTVALAVGSWSFFGLLHWRSAPLPPLGQLPSSAAVEVGAGLEVGPSRFPFWTAPVAQARGPEWVYETFTAPEIAYDPATRQFTVLSADAANAAEDRIEPFGVELISLEPEALPLRLIGHSGAPEKWRGVFQNTITGEVFLAQRGDRLPRLGLELLDLDVRAELVALEHGSVLQRVASARVRDVGGAEVPLQEGKPAWRAAYVARLAIEGEVSGRALRVGDFISTSSGATYWVESVQAPWSVQIVKEMPGRPVERRLLVLPSSDEGDQAIPSAYEPEGPRTQITP